VSDAFVHSAAVMGTVVTIEVVGHGATAVLRREREAGVAHAMGWFQEITSRCSRFDPRSEVNRIADRPGQAVEVSAMTFEAIRFALAVAEETGGAFDPTVGQRMEELGFNRDYRTGEATAGRVATRQAVSYRDVSIDPVHLTVRTACPLVLDLGAVAKGLAIDLAARELRGFRDFAIDAGGDLYCGGSNRAGEPWSVGIRHPRRPGEVLVTLRVSEAAVCTSGDYERRGDDDSAVHHLLDARTGATATTTASVTVMAPSAMVADALSTAAFVLGPTEGLSFLERQGVEGMFITPELQRFATQGFPA
jgi:thiamine biosynthesis lipoprotein